MNRDGSVSPERTRASEGGATPPRSAIPARGKLIPLRTGSTPPVGGAGASGSGAVAVVLGGVLALGLGLALATARHVVAPDLRDLSPALRTEVFAGSLREVRSVCFRPEAALGALRQHCLEEGQFILQLPECDSACRAELAPLAPRPNR